MKPLWTEGDYDDKYKNDGTIHLNEHQAKLQQEKEDLELELARLKTALENDLDYEKKQHEKTILELARARHQNRELKKDVHHLQNKLRMWEKEMEEQNNNTELKTTGEFKPVESGVSKSIKGKSLVNTSINDPGGLQMKAYQDKSDYLASENARLLKRVEEMEAEIANYENKVTDFQGLYEKLVKESENKIAVLVNENVNLTKDNEGLRERIEKLEIELDRLKTDNLELKRRYSDVANRNLAVDPETPNKSSEAKLTNNSTPQSNPLGGTKSFTTSKKVMEGKSGERGLFMGRKIPHDVGELELPDCVNLISRILEIYQIKSPSEIIPSIKKTEKVIHAIPKLHKLLAEIASIIFSKKGLSSGEGDVEMIIPYLKNWSNKLDELEAQRELKKKLIEKIGLSRDCQNIEILRNVDDLLYISFQYEDMRLRSQRELNENVEQKMIIEQLTKMTGSKPSVGLVKQMMAQLNDLRHFITLAKNKLDLDDSTSNEACLTKLLKYLGKSKRDNQELGMASERRNPLAYEPKKHFK